MSLGVEIPNGGVLFYPAIYEWTLPGGVTRSTFDQQYHQIVIVKSSSRPLAVFIDGVEQRTPFYPSSVGVLGNGIINLFSVSDYGQPDISQQFYSSPVLARRIRLFDTPLASYQILNLDTTPTTINAITYHASIRSAYNTFPLEIQIDGFTINPSDIIGQIRYFGAGIGDLSLLAGSMKQVTPIQQFLSDCMKLALDAFHLMPILLFHFALPLFQHVSTMTLPSHWVAMLTMTTKICLIPRIPASPQDTFNRVVVLSSNLPPLRITLVARHFH
jgi:hypothetical protein